MGVGGAGGEREEATDLRQRDRLLVKGLGRLCPRFGRPCQLIELPTGQKRRERF